MSQRPTAVGRPHGGRDRGATLLEYALGISVFLLAIIGAIELLTDSASERFAEGGGAGAPAEANGVFGTRDASPGGGGGGGGGGGPAILVASASLTGSSTQSGPGNSPFTATVTVSATDQTGAPVAGAAVELSWSGNVSGSTSLVTDGAGEVSHSVSGIQHNRSVTFTVTAVTAEGYDFTLPPPISLTKNS